MKKSVLIAAAVFLGCLSIGLGVRSGLRAIASRDNNVAVRGLAEREVMADKVTWPVVYKLVGNDLQSIYENVESNNRTVIDFLTSNGLSADEFSLNAPIVTDKQAETYSSSDSPYRYTVTCVITVTSSKVDLVNRLIQRQGELMQNGVAVTVGDWNYRTIYEYTGLNDIKPDMIAEATRNAREAADKFAEDSGGKIRKMIRASQGQFSIEDRDPYTPYIKRVRVVTTLTYAID